MNSTTAPVQPAARTSAPSAPSGRPPRRWLPLIDVPIVFIVVGIAGTFLSGNVQFLAATILIYVLLAASTNMLVGWQGIVTFGHAAYFGIGTYLLALLRGVTINPLLLLLIAGIVGSLAAAGFAALTARLNGIAFAMMTLVFGQVLYQLVYTVPALHGDDGISGIPSGQLFGKSLLLSQNFWWYAVIVVGVCLTVLRVISKSSFGRTVLATRDDELRAIALGVPVRTTRVLVMAIAGFFAAVAGALFVQQQGIASSDNLYWLASGNAVLMCLIGGVGYFWGPAIGAAIFVWLNTEVFNSIPYADLFIGIILLAVVLLFRGGIAGLAAQAARAVARRVRPRVRSARS
jgi:branched-chain amino acid transport system permease protein